MDPVTRRRFLAGSATAAVAAPFLGHPAFAQGVVPRLTLITNLHHGGDAVAIKALGDYFESKGGKFEHTAVPGFTTDMLNKLRSEIMAGNPPAVSFLKGPEIKTWSKLAPTVSMDEWVDAADFARFIDPALAETMKPNGHWIALPLQIHRVNTLWISKKAMAAVGETAFPTTWEQYDVLSDKMRAAGIVPLGNGGRRDDDGIKFDVALSSISPEIYRRAIQNLDEEAMKSPEMIEAFRRLRKLSEYLTPDVGSTDWVDYVPAFIAGKKGMLLQGTWAQSFIASQGFSAADYMVGPAPQKSGTPAFVLNADSWLFWERKEPDLAAGQKLFAQVLMSKEGQQVFPKVSGAIPARSDIDLSGPAWSDGQRNMVSSLANAMRDKTVVLTLSQNLAQTNDITAAMTDVITEFVHDASVTPEDGASMLHESVAGFR
jgi:glucose/mannose transport system substrate-binding protein